MPVRRLIAKERRRVTLDDLGIGDLLCFLSGWSPPGPLELNPWRWATWGDFIGEYEALRGEVLARWPVDRRGRPSFAERVYQAHLNGRGPTGTGPFEE